MLVSVAAAEAQTGTITGRVTDAQNGQPLAAAQVFIEAQGLGVLTRQNGSYLLVNVPPGTHTVGVQRIGYRDATAEVTVGAGATVTRDFRVQEEALALDEVVVTGTVGQQQRRAVANSVTSVDASAIANSVPLASMQEMLASRAPGVNFGTQTGVIGQGSPITIRGFSSIQLGNQPLIYIDGVRYDNSHALGPAGSQTGRDAGGSNVSALDDIDPNSIESIEIIKGPAAATLYGSEASAGVIQIITKKGITGAPEFNLTVRQGQFWMKDPAAELGEMWGCSATGGGTTGSSAGSPVFACGDGTGQDNPMTGEPFTGAGYDWDESEDNLYGPWNIYEYYQSQGRDIFQNGYGSGYNLGVRGGTDQVRYFVSGDWLSDEGVVSYNTAERLSLRSNVDVLFNDNLTVSFNAGYTDGLTQFAQQSPTQDGAWTEMYFAQADHLQDTSINPRGPSRCQTSDEDNVCSGFYERDVGAYEDVEATRDFQRLTLSLAGQHTVGDWLTQRVVFGLDRNWDDNHYYVPRNVGNEDYPFPNESDGQINDDTQIGQRLSFDYNVSAEYQLNEMLSLTTSAGVQYNTSDRSTVEVSGSNLPSPVFNSLQNILQFDDPDKSVGQDRSLGFFVQETVGLNDRLYLTGAVRADDHSGFGRETDLLYYPKVSASWVVSEEPFWNIGLLDEVRLRSAFGASGRAPNAFARTAQFEQAVGPGLTPALRMAQAGNPSVEPERSSELEVGIDFALLDQRISGEFTWFKQWVREALVSASINPSEAFTGGRSENLGGINNTGWEAALNLRIVESPAFSFDLRLGADHADNVITKLTEEQQDINFVEGYYYPNVVFTHLERVEQVDATDPSSIITDPYDPTIGYAGFCDLGADGPKKFRGGRSVSRGAPPGRRPRTLRLGVQSGAGAHGRARLLAVHVHGGARVQVPEQLPGADRARRGSARPLARRHRRRLSRDGGGVLRHRSPAQKLAGCLRDGRSVLPGGAGDQ
jgi:TonB-linked SusC/RagA family outer membrane protein